MKKIWLVAAENDALPHGKVGGVGDVVRDLPIALAGLGLEVTVITPSYGMFHTLPGAEPYQKIRVEFAGQSLIAHVFELPGAGNAVRQFVIEHEILSPEGPGKIYVNDPPGNPFAIDSAKFAFFNAAVAALVNSSDNPPDVLHLNDWHTGLIPALKVFGSRDAALSRVRTVFTIHNLAYQGIRPFRGHPSSLESWFPELLEHEAELVDPRYPECVNFMASAIRLADAINTVSPNYAMEIQRASDPSTGFSGGEGLEDELKTAFQQGRLTGIINGCMYPEQSPSALQWDELLALIATRPDIMNANLPPQQWIENHKGQPPDNLLLSIGRVVDQKVPLFLHPVGGERSALEVILETLGPKSLFIMVGNGDRNLEERFVEIARTCENFLFVRGYVEGFAGPLYATADLFLMPSSFEPCGISQMLAMRAGQPCVVHAVGGLKDTVEHGVTGFVFDGASPLAQAENFVRCVLEAVTLKQKKPAQWRKICSNAALQRFSWPLAAQRYLDTLYQHD